MNNNIAEIAEIEEEIEWLESQQVGLEMDDIDYISLQFEINMNREYIQTIKNEMGG